MADIELVIKIPESEIPKQQDIIEIPLHFIDREVCEAGGYEFDVLPKGHGRLIDADKITNEMNGLKDNWNRYGNEYESGKYESYDYAVDVIDNAPTIIEADKENKQ